MRTFFYLKSASIPAVITALLSAPAWACPDGVPSLVETVQVLRSEEDRRHITRIMNESLLEANMREGLDPPGSLAESRVRIISTHLENALNWTQQGLVPDYRVLYEIENSYRAWLRYPETDTPESRMRVAERFATLENAVRDRTREALRPLVETGETHDRPVAIERTEVMNRIRTTMLDAHLRENFSDARSGDGERARTVIEALTRGREWERQGLIRNPLSLQRLETASRAYLEATPTEVSAARRNLMGAFSELQTAVDRFRAGEPTRRATSRTDATRLVRESIDTARRRFRPARLQRNAIILDTNLAIEAASLDIRDLNRRGAYVTETTACELVGRPSGFARMVTLAEGARETPEFSSILNELEAAQVGANKGYADRQIIVEALFASSRGGSPPTFVTADTDVFTRLARFAVDPRLRSISPNQLVERFGRTRSQPVGDAGFEIEILGRRLRIVPFTTQSP